jgi:hypothetical protein
MGEKIVVNRILFDAGVYALQIARRSMKRKYRNDESFKLNKRPVDATIIDERSYQDQD